MRNTGTQHYHCDDTQLKCKPCHPSCTNGCFNANACCNSNEECDFATEYCDLDDSNDPTHSDYDSSARFRVLEDEGRVFLTRSDRLMKYLLNESVFTNYTSFSHYEESQSAALS